MGWMIFYPLCIHPLWYVITKCTLMLWTWPCAWLWVIEWSRSVSMVLLSLQLKRPCSFLCFCHLHEDIPEVAYWHGADTWQCPISLVETYLDQWTASWNRQVNSLAKRHRDSRHVPSWYLPCEQYMLLYYAIEALWLFITWHYYGHK